MRAYKSVTFILATMLFLTTSIIYKTAHAENYINLYGSTELSSISTATSNEVSYDKSNVIMLFGVKSGGIAGFNAELFFNSSGGGAAVGSYATIGDIVFSGGLISVSENSKGSIDRFDDGYSANRGNGFYLGVSYKLLSIRLVDYSINHNYSSKKLIGYNPRTTHHNKYPVFARGRSTDSLKRQLLWVGFNVPF